MSVGNIQENEGAPMRAVNLSDQKSGSPSKARRVNYSPFEKAWPYSWQPQLRKDQRLTVVEAIKMKLLPRNTDWKDFQ